MAVIAVVQQLEKKSKKQGKKKKNITKVRLGGFCDWKPEGGGNEETTADFYKISRADEDDKPVQHCLIPQIVKRLLISC